MYGQEILSDILQDSWVSIKLKLHLSALIGYFRKKVNDKLQLGCIKKTTMKALHLIFNSTAARI